MAFYYNCVLILLLLSLTQYSDQAQMANQSQFFTIMKKSLRGELLSGWDLAAGEKPFCNFTGIECNKQGFVVKIDLSGRSLSGRFPEPICSYLPALRILRLDNNNLAGDFPRSITNCSVLEELNMSTSYVTGELPDLSPLTALRVLDLSYNLFSGKFPVSFTNLTNLEMLNFNENEGFSLWELPENVSRLTKLRSMILTTCMVRGHIPASIGKMTSLVDLELSGNFLVGRIPAEIGLLKNLKQLELYYNQITGEIPPEIGNLTELVDLDMSVNMLTGKIPESIFRLTKLEAVQLYNNSLTGGIPRAIENSTKLTTLSFYDNFFTGEIPRGLGKSSPLVILELSENGFSGELPAEACNGGKLLYFLVLENNFSGKIPESYGKCTSLVRFRVSYNRLEGSIPESIMSLPQVSIIDLGYNRLDGSIPNTIGNAKNLSELFVQNNKLTGVLPPEISRVSNMVKIDVSYNLVSGPIPFEIGNLRNLNLLMLQSNKFNSSIPDSISSLKSLNVLDLSSNFLTGKIPESLSSLLPNSMNFSNNNLTGSIPLPFIKGGLLESFSNNPGLCLPANSLTIPDTHLPKCPQPIFPTNDRRKSSSTTTLIWVIVASIAILLVGTTLLLRRWFGKKQNSSTENEETFSTSLYSYDVKSFHRVSFDQREIAEAMVDENIVAHGGSGTVYKIELGSGEVIAVKKLWSRKDQEQFVLDKELKTEVETLASIRHKNIVKLYSYFSSLDCSLLVYEFMPNGNLWDSLHSGKSLLDWPIRHQIALGVAQGLAYLHHDLKQCIIHRDIKSTNILLDGNYHPKVADFGIAKVMQARGGGSDSTTTIIAGTYGYLAPEYAYYSKATTKCDVYSFGVLLMELITGRKPMEAEFGENKSLIQWVSTKCESIQGAVDVLDKRLSGLFKESMIKTLKIAIRCTYDTPAIRPNMNEVAQLLIEADPCSFGCSNKTK